MSIFECKIRKIDSVETHPNADALDLAVIGGYRAVVKRDEFKAGDLALYIPDDTLFTDISIAAKLGIAPYLTGKGKNRVKPVRLRGSLSQGIVVPFSKLDDITSELGFGFLEHREGYELSEELKVEKYEEPIPMQMQGKVRNWPSFLSKYDVENIKRPESFSAMVIGEPVVATEKLHGTNITIAIGPGLEEGERAFVCSRNNALKEDGGTNVYWRAVHKWDLLSKIEKMASFFSMGDRPFESVAIHGEVIGVQDLKYGCVNGEIEFAAFDISVNGQFMGFDQYLAWVDELEIPSVPLIYRGPYDYHKLELLANQGLTDYNQCHIKEGIVVKPDVERIDPYAGRVNFKFINENYLLRKGGTELH